MLAFAQNSFVFSTCYFLSRESSGDIPCGPPVLAPLSVCANIAASTQPSGRSAPAGALPHWRALRTGREATPGMPSSAPPRADGCTGHEQMLYCAGSSLMRY
jgi:hypothetical protein